MFLEQHSPPKVQNKRMLIPEFIPPPNHLRFLVWNFLLLEAKPDAGLICDKYIPDGHGALVFNFNATVSMIYKGRKDSLPDCFLVPPMIDSIFIEVTPPSESRIAICYMPALSKLFKTDMSCIAKHPYVTKESIPWLRGFDELKNACSLKDFIPAFESALTRLAGETTYNPDEIDHAYHLIMAEGGTRPVEDLISMHCIKSRTFRRKFLQRTGIPAKALSRIRRVHHFWNLIRQNPKPDYLELALLAGYYDLPHFVHDFKRIAGETPDHFFKRNLSLVHALSGKPVV